jgi:primosomal protein N' (replication factor Y)
MVLQVADFRSGQKAFLSITSAIRFLREGEESRLVIQTSAPDHYSIREAARGDYGAFFDQEIKFRRLLDYPPFSCLAEVFFSGGNLRRLAGVARMFVDQIKAAGKSIQVYGPALSPTADSREPRRVQVNLKARRTETIVQVLAQALPAIRVKKTVFLFD